MHTDSIGLVVIGLLSFSGLAVVLFGGTIAWIVDWWKHRKESDENEN